MEYKYSAVLYGYLDSWLFRTVEKPVYHSAARATPLYPLLFSRLMRNEQRDFAEKKKLNNK